MSQQQCPESQTLGTTLDQSKAGSTLDQSKAGSILAAVTRDATIAYPAETARILRGMAIVVDEGVVYTGGMFWVQSQTHEERQYRVGRTCFCADASRAPEGRCKHRWAKVLYVKMHVALTASSGSAPAAPVTPDAAPRARVSYYATLYPHATALEGQQGTATKEEGCWTFTPDNGDVVTTVHVSQVLVLGGRVDLCAAQRERDGESLGAKFGQPQYPQYE